MRILWIVLGALLLVSVTPLWLYHRQVLRLSEEKLQDTERVQQSEITRSLASETLQFEQNLREQLQSQRQVLALTGWIENVDDPTRAADFAPLQDFVENNPNILYVTAVNKEAKGQSAGSSRATRIRSSQAALKRAFTASIQGLTFVSEPSPSEGQPARARHLRASFRRRPVHRHVRRRGFDRPLAGAYSAMRACATAPSTSWMGTATSSLTPNTREYRSRPRRHIYFSIVKQLTELPQELRATETMHFTEPDKNKTASGGNDRHLQHHPGASAGR